MSRQETGGPSEAREGSLIALIEPQWGDYQHSRFNLCLLQATLLAFPRAQVLTLGERIQQQTHLARLNTVDCGRVDARAWLVGPDRDTLPLDVLRQWRAVKRATGAFLRQARNCFLSSATANTLTVITLLGLAARSLAWLHGDASELVGWRSRNPVRRMLDFRATAQRFVQAGGRFAVMEDHIAARLRRELPWLGEALVCLPFPVLGKAPANTSKNDSPPWLIGFMGLASPSKGFAQFLRVSRVLAASQPGRFEFRAVGKLHPDAQSWDQSVLTRMATCDPVSEERYEAEFRKLDFVFEWYDDDYYGFAASGVFYDALEYAVPIIGRRTEQVERLAADGNTVGLFEDSVEGVIRGLSSIDDLALATLREQGRTGTHRLRSSHTVEHLARRLALVVG